MICRIANSIQHSLEEQTFALLTHRVARGKVENVKHALPAELRELWR